MSASIRFISAGAGSGKTYRLTELLKEAVTSGGIRPGGVIGTTFTKKAAAELHERVRRHLFAAGKNQAAIQIGQALLGTVNSVCGQLLSRFAFEMGLSPDLEVIPEEESQPLFDQLLETVVSLDRLRSMSDIAYRLDLEDWKKTVKNIVDASRANDMEPEAVRGFGPVSADELLGYFPPQSDTDPHELLLPAVDAAIAGIEANEDTTKGTQKYITFLKEIRPDVAKERLKWSTWVKLSKDKPTRRSQELSEAVREAALRYDAHPLLHADIRRCCETVFALAAEALEAYQAFKRKRGLIDYVDQEQLVLRALDHPTIAAVLESEIDLLLVDEFQDTSPIQLALFMKLAALASEAVFVGDLKQAIYGFRGSDPELMQAVLREVTARGGHSEVLGNSYRSRPPLVDYANAVFCSAFGETIPDEQIRLKAVRKDPPSLAEAKAVEKWLLQGSNIGLRASALGKGVLNLVGSGREIIDPETKSSRQVRYGDIAVFARTHNRVAQFADAFAAVGIPVNMERAGLLGTPEACLALACLRRLSDPFDTLASAEVIALSSGEPPETWLNHRLEYLDAGNDGHRWGEEGSYPLLQRLAEHRQQLRFLTPAEAMAFVVELADLRRVAVAWGPNEWRAAQRLNNLDGLVTLAEQYEEHCRTRRTAATVGGLLLWFNEIKDAGKDPQPKDLSGDAVTLSTHHGAKGLEWPVVIATDLEGNIWRRLWDLNVVSNNARIDLEAPLANRRLRYWPWPFGSQQTGIAVTAKIEASKWGQVSLKRDTEEARRLLYVSLTRARDLLVLPFAEKKQHGPWIDALGTDWMMPENDRLCLEDGCIIPTALRTYGPPEEEEQPPAGYHPFWFGERLALTSKLVEPVSPSSLPGMETARIEDLKNIGAGIPVKGKPDMTALGEVLHAFLSTMLINPDREGLPELAESMLKSKGLTGYVEPNDVVRSSGEFIRFLEAAFKPKRIWSEHPLTHVLETGQVVRGWIDVLVDADTGWVIVDHKITREDPSAIVRTYAGQIAAYRHAVQAATGRRVLSSWIHLPLTGEMVRWCSTN